MRIHASKKEHTEEIKRFTNGNVAGRFSFVERYQPSMWNVEPVQTITVHMCKLGKNELQCCGLGGRTHLFHLLQPDAFPVLQPIGANKPDLQKTIEVDHRLLQCQDGIQNTRSGCKVLKRN